MLRSPVKLKIRGFSAFVYKNREHFHSNNKRIGGEGIPLTKTSGPFEVPTQLTIDFNREPGSGDAGFYPINKLRGKFKKIEGFKKEFPRDRVKSFP